MPVLMVRSAKRRPWSTWTSRRDLHRSTAFASGPSVIPASCQRVCGALSVTLILAACGRNRASGNGAEWRPGYRKAARAACGNLSELNPAAGCDWVLRRDVVARGAAEERVRDQA